jgi:hypothetical protein
LHRLTGRRGQFLHKGIDANGLGTFIFWMALIALRGLVSLQMRIVVADLLGKMSHS